MSLANNMGKNIVLGLLIPGNHVVYTVIRGKKKKPKTILLSFNQVFKHVYKCEMSGDMEYWP